MDPPLTPSQLLYLEAFDNFLLARTDQQRLDARVQMSRRLNFVFAEANMELPNDTEWEDSFGWERAPNRRFRRRLGLSVKARRQPKVNGRFARRGAA